MPRVLATDGAGNVYVGGSTSTGIRSWPTNVFNLNTPGETNDMRAFVMKFDPLGTPIYLTYLGGSGWESVYGIAADTNGSVCVVGSTSSTNFPIVNALQPLPAESGDHPGEGFITKLSPSGKSLVFSTYYGGTGADYCADVEIAQDGSLVVIGSTSSTNLWAVNALQATNAGGAGRRRGYPIFQEARDIFIAKLHHSGTSLDFATYFGGRGEDNPVALALDPQGNVYVTGHTYSTNFPTMNTVHTIGPTEPYISDAFLVKLSSDGQGVLYSTLLGGSASEFPYDMVVDTSGRATVVGATTSGDFPWTNSLPIGPLVSLELDGRSRERGFVARFSADGLILDYSTALGALGSDPVTGAALDATGNLLVAGFGSSLTTGSSPAAFSYVASINSNGDRVTSATKTFDCAYSQIEDLNASASGVIWALGMTIDASVPNQPYTGWSTFLRRIPAVAPETNPAPLVELSRPADGGYWGTDQPIPLVVTAADAGGQIREVQFFADSVLIGAATNPPYQLNWASAIPGVRTLHAVAVDSFGAMATSCVAQINVVTPPVNDQFENSTPIYGVGLAMTGSLHGASLEPGEPSGSSVTSRITPPPSEITRSIWWCWQAPSNGVYAISTEGTDFPAAVLVYTGTGLNDLTFVTTPRLLGSALGSAVFRATAGTIYFINVAGNSEVAGNAILHIRPANRPPNDDFENRILLAGMEVTATGSTAEATTQPLAKPGFPLPLPYSPAGADVWWSWIAPTNGVFLMTAEGSAFHSELGIYYAFAVDLSIYTGSTFTNLATVTSSTSSDARVTLNAVAGTRYEILVNSTYDNFGEFQLSITPIASPPNDAFSNAIPIIGSSHTATGTTFGATAEPFEPAGASARSVWWNWTPTAPGAHKFKTTDDQILRIYSGTVLSNLTPIASGEAIVFNTRSGVDYRIALDSGGEVGGAAQFTIEPVTRPSNDDFANRIALPGLPVIIMGNAANSTVEPGEPSLGFSSSPEGSVWWSWTAPASNNYSLAVEATSSSSQAQVFQGDDLTNLIAISDILYGPTISQYNVQFSADAGESVLFRVFDEIEATSEFQYSITPAPQPPPIPNDYFSNRMELVGAEILIPVSNAGASLEAGEPGASCYVGHTVWWTWTAPSNGPFTISAGQNSSVVGFSGSTLSLYTGTNVAALSKLAQNSYGEISFWAQTNQPYQIAVGECSTPGREFTLQIRPANPPINDAFTNRLMLEGPYAFVLASCRDATSEPREPRVSIYDPPNQRTLWWSWTAAASGKTVVTAGGRFAIYTGASLETLTRLTNSSSSKVDFTASAGTTYHIQLDSNQAGDISISVHGVHPASPARFISARQVGSALELGIAGAFWRSHTHTLEYSPDLTQWFTLTNIPPMLPDHPLLFLLMDAPAQFYRLRSH